MIKSVIFDVDGVLVDSFEANYAYFLEIFQKAGYAAPTKEEYRHMFHISLADMVRLVAKNPEATELARVLAIAGTVRYHIEDMKLAPDSQEVVARLAEKYRLGIVTGRNEAGAEEYLDHSKLRKYFATVVHYEHYANPKPHPEPILLALKKLDIGPEEAVYIGDAEIDFQSATAAGLRFILFGNKAIKGLECKIENFCELPALLEKIERLRN